MKDIFTFLKVMYVPYIPTPSSQESPCIHWSTYCLQSFILSRVSSMGNAAQRLASFTRSYTSFHIFLQPHTSPLFHIDCLTILTSHCLCLFTCWRTSQLLLIFSNYEWALLTSVPQISPKMDMNVPYLPLSSKLAQMDHRFNCQMQHRKRAQTIFDVVLDV